jgi:LPS-assembly protein
VPFTARLPTLLICVSALGATPWAQTPDLCLPVPSSTEPAAAPPTTPADSGQIEIQAGRVQVGTDDNAEFSDQVEFRRGDRSISAERASYDRAGQRVEVAGRVTYQDPDLTVYGENAEVDTENEEIRFSGAGFMPKRPARGAAKEILVTRAGTATFSDVNFTTCPGERPDWEFIAGEISLDTDKGFGTARAVKLKFKGVPILYSPYITFPIDEQRKSGFLTPHLAKRDRTGLDLGVPYYLNLAPNYDMTLEPRYLSKRGTQLNTEFRYLLDASSGQINFEYLPNDSEADRTRRYINFAHETALGERWQINTVFAEISDDAYFEDLGSSLAVTSQTHLNRYVDISYFAPSWSLLSRFQDYQTIDPFLVDEEKPYERVPQLLFNGRWLSGRARFESRAELVNFERNVGVTGWRLDSTQEASMRFQRRGAFLTPAVALRQTGYWLDRIATGGDATPSRTLPVASIDAGIRLERTSQRRNALLQTLEPRLLYVYIPYEDQTALPVFDTVQPDYGMVQLFRKYQFVGADRIADAERLSVGITTRLIDPQTGDERLTATLGQTRYLTTQRVSLPDQPANDANASDYVAELGMSLQRNWNLNVGYQWNTTTDLTTRAETRLEYRPKDDRLFGFGYRYREGLLEQGDISLVWPAARRWRVIGRYSYSFLEQQPLEQFLGWEYDSCCWRMRLVGRKYISTRTGESDSSVLVQLELKGLTQRGASPEQLLDRGILGYRGIGSSEAR